MHVRAVMTGKAKAAWTIAVGAALVALAGLTLSMRSGSGAASTSAAVAAPPGAPGAPGASGADPQASPTAPREAAGEASAALQAKAGPRHGNRPDRDRRWRERMDRIDKQARAVLDLDDATAQKLDALQQKLRHLKQDARDGLDRDGQSRKDVVTRIAQRTRGFRAQVVKLLGKQRAEIYLGIVDGARSGAPPAPEVSSPGEQTAPHRPAAQDG